MQINERFFAKIGADARKGDTDTGIVVLSDSALACANSPEITFAKLGERQSF